MKDERLERLRFQISEDLAAGTQKSVAEYAALFPNQDLLVSRAYVEAHTLGLNILDASDEGEFIGPYRLEKELGRGGQGVVYLAEDTRLHRRVALKVLQGLGPDAKTHLQRFRREAEVASKLDHPGICGVYEAGMAGEIPFIAMRFVEGETLAAITDRAKQAGSSAPSELLSTFFLDARDDETTDASVSAEASDESRDQKSSTRATSVNRKAVNEVLSIYEKAARALHVAHEAGIIHRDIKPGNIMITRDREPVLLDFGLAREETSDLASLTMTGDVFGTPAYMSPEQVRGERGSIDRRSDTYSLGVSLFESLTLRRPFESATRQGLYQQILSSEAPGARQFNSAIPRDLEVVLETVLAKNKDHRYQTAAAFADELGHVLRMEPIVSRPSGPLVKTLRWAQRNPALAVALSALVLCISVGLIVALISLARTRRALAGERHARTEAEEVTNFFERVLQSVDPGIKGADVSVLEVLDDMRQALDTEFVGRPLLEARLRRTIGISYTALAQYDKAIEHLRVALSLRERELGARHPEVADVRLSLARIHQLQGNREQTRIELEKVRTILDDATGTDSAQYADYLVCLAQQFHAEADYPNAEKVHREALEVRRRVLDPGDTKIASSLQALAFIVDEQKRHDEALELCEESLSINRARLGNAHVDVAVVLGDLALIQQHRGQLEASAAALREAMGIAEGKFPEDHPRLANLQWRLASLLQERESPEAEDLARRALATRRARLGPDHVDIATSLAQLGNILSQKGEYREAEEFHHQALTMRQTLFGKSHVTVASSLQDLGTLEVRRHRLDEAAEYFEESLDMWIKVEDAESMQQFSCRNQLAVVVQNRGDLELAEELFRENLALLRRLAGDQSLGLARAMNNLGSLLFRRDKLEESEDLIRRALAMRRELVSEDHPSLRESLGNLAFLLDARGDFAEAEALHREFVRLALAALPGGHSTTTGGRGRLGLNLLKQEKWTDAEETLRDYLRDLQQSEPEGHWQRLHAQSLLGFALLKQQRFTEAEPLVLAAARGLTVAEAGSARRRRVLEHAVALYVGWNQPEKAAPWRRELEILDE